MRREQYYFKIQVYRKRREDYREKYAGEIAIYKTERYKKLTMRISQWQKEIKRLDARKNKIGNLLKLVNEYFNAKIQERNNKYDLPRKIFFKIGLEQNICGTHLSRFIGRVNSDVASLNRKSLIKSYNTKPENLEAFRNFKKYLGNEETISQSNGTVAHLNDLPLDKAIGKEAG